MSDYVKCLEFFKDIPDAEIHDILFYHSDNHNIYDNVVDVVFSDTILTFTFDEDGKFTNFTVFVNK